jgi:aspartate aminotransferase-like enzyme
MPGLRPDVDPDGLLEYSVVYTDRALNHMSQSFQSVMTDVSRTLRDVYSADSATIVPGSGTFGMEAVARQFATDQHCLVLRNGFFSYRWTQIFEMGSIPSSHTVLAARRATEGPTEPFAPAPLDEVVATIESERPAVVFAPHVETSTICARSRRRPTRSTACSCSTASPRARSGSTWPTSASMSWSAPRRRAGRALRSARS